MQLALNRKHFNFLVADLQAAAFCIEVIAEPDDRVVGRKFLSIHQFFLRNIDRDRPELFAQVDRAMLVDLVRRWMRLYLLALAELRQRFPRTDDSPDLVMKGRNWSEELDVSFEGLDRLDIASRYAEFWAERSIHDPAIRATFEQRCAMVGSPCYVENDQLNRDHQLLIVDAFTNGIPAYDVQCAMRERGSGSARGVVSCAGLADPGDDGARPGSAGALVNGTDLAVRSVARFPHPPFGGTTGR